MKFWRHTHRFEAVGPSHVRVSEHIELEHFSGWRGLLGRLLFSRPALRGLFFYRSWVTRRALDRRGQLRTLPL